MSERIGHYRLVRRIAAGGYGVVYEGVHTILGTSAAVKVMNIAATDDRIDEFKREAKRVSRLGGHEGVIEVRDFGYAKDERGGRRPYLVMKLLRGGRSLTRFADEENLKLNARLEMMAKVCDAVHFAHEAGIVHLDLTPNNIRIDESPKRPPHPVVIDFGISRAADPDADQLNRTRIVGTLPYMSPEQTRGSDGLDCRSDVYSLGVVLYELLCGQYPYPLGDADVTRIFETIRNTPPDFRSESAARLPRDIVTILSIALQKSPDNRYRTASALAEDLRAVLRGELPSPKRATTMQRARAALRRTALRWPRAALFAAIVIGAIVSDQLLRPLVFDWTPMGTIGERWCLERARIERIENVVTVVRRDSTMAFAGMPGLPPEERWKLRPFLAETLMAIAEAKPRCIGIDMLLKRPSVHDEELAHAIRSVSRDPANPIPVIVTADGTITDPDGTVRPNVLPEIVAAADGYGHPDASKDPSAPVWVTLGVFGDTPNPLVSLVLRTYAASMEPKLKPVFVVEPGRSSIRILFDDPDSAGLAARRTEVVDATRIVLNLPPQEYVAGIVVPPMTPAVFDASAVTMEDVIRRDPQAMQRLAGKIVLVSADQPDDDRLERDEGNFPGVAMNAVGIDLLTRKLIFRAPTVLDEIGLILACSVAGGMLGYRLIRRNRWLPVWAVVVKLVITAAAGLTLGLTMIVLGWSSRLLISPAMIAGTLTLAAAFAVLMTWTWNRAAVGLIGRDD